MKEIRFFVYVLLCSGSLVHVDVANNEPNAEKQVVSQGCPTSPVIIKHHGTSPITDSQNNRNIQDHGTTPVDLGASLRLGRFPSCPSCSALAERANSLSEEDWTALGLTDHSPNKCPLNAVLIIAAAHSPNSPKKGVPLDQLNVNLHGTTPVKSLLVPARAHHGTTPVDPKK